MRTRSTPALTAALTYIENLRRVGAAPNERLATVTNLARLAGVSPRTMHQAVRALVNTGVLSAKQRTGIRWADVQRAITLPPKTPGPQIHATRAQRLSAEIQTDVLSGALADPLPSIKSLRARYAVGYDTVRRALISLGDHGSIRLHGRRWTVVRAKTHSELSKVVLIAPGDALRNFATYGTKVADFCSILERQCTVNEVSLLFRSSFRPVKPDRSALGYIVVAAHNAESVASIVLRLSRSGRPIVIVDILGDCATPALPRLRQTAIVSIQGATSAARQVALNLRALGHRRIAYLSAYGPEGTTWVGDRMRGLREVYGGDAVAFWNEDLTGPERTHAWVERDVIPSIERKSASLAAAIDRRTMASGCSDWLTGELVRPVISHYTESRMRPLFERALADSSITAWVGANDQAALCALRLLAERRIAVPHNLSVTGFDGTLDGVLARLSSYDFNIPACVETILGLVLRPVAPARTARPVIIDIPGVFLLRDTVTRIY